jgi:predicted ester cyclase
MSKENTAIVRRFAAAMEGQDYAAVVRETVADESVAHLPLGDHYGQDGLMFYAAEWGRAFPDLSVVHLDLFGEGDRVARRFQLSGTHLGPFPGLAPTGRRMEIAGMVIDRLAAGRIQESWVVVDPYSLERQLSGEPSFKTLGKSAGLARGDAHEGS